MDVAVPTNERPVPNAQINASFVCSLKDRSRKLQTGGTHVAKPSIMSMGPHAVHAIMGLVARLIRKLDFPLPETDIARCYILWDAKCCEAV